MKRKLMEEVKDGSFDNLGFTYGKKYPLKIETTRKLFNLQYAFKPSNIDNSKEGRGYIKSNNEAFIHLQTSEDSIDDFKGVCSDKSLFENECIVEFDGECFSISRIEKSLTNIKKVSSENNANSSMIKKSEIPKNIPKYLGKLASQKNKLNSSKKAKPFEPKNIEA